MMKTPGRRRNTKAKASNNASTVPEKCVKKAEHHADISRFFDKQRAAEKTTDTLSFPESSLPSPDAAALPCSSSLCSHAAKTKKESKNLQKPDQMMQDKIMWDPSKENKNLPEMNQKTSNSKALKKKKKQAQPLNNTFMTDFYPVRRSNRKPLPTVLKEKHKSIEEAILSGKEEGFEVKEFPGKGRGVVAKRPIKRGEFVLEYYGEVIDNDEAARRESEYATKENIGCYMYYFTFSNKKYCIDATKESGRLGRLVNHSKRGNLKTQPLSFRESCPPHLALFARRDIAPGEELSYDYGDRSRQSLQANPWLAL